MRSPVNWALLGLVIDRPSYAYELARRFERTYRDVLSLSSLSHIYTALGALQDRSLSEERPGARPGRQPKPVYRATPLGIESYGEWLVSYVGEDRRRQVRFVLGLSALARNPNLLLEVLQRYEQAWLAPETETTVFELGSVPEGPGRELAGRILSEQNELTVAAKLRWLRQVRQALEDLAPADGI
jgi:DNA-binding PadR family transcriptional regulator